LIRTLVRHKLSLALAALVWALPAGASAAVTPKSTVVSHIADGRIKESSGLAYSVKYPNLAYTMNDSKNRAVVYAIQVSTGRVVGQVDLERYDLEDPESIAVDAQGRLWLGDLGDNDSDRDDTSILVFNEPGTGSKTPQGLQRFRIEYQGGPENVEGMMVSPTTRRVFLINKTDGGAATLYGLPPSLRNGAENVATNLRRPMPARVSDAAFTPDGRYALVKTATSVVAYDVTTWKPVTSFPTPGLDKGESLTVEPGGRSILLGSEGNDSPIVRVTLPADLRPAAATASPSPPADDAQGAASSALPPLGSPAPDVTPAEPANGTVPVLLTIAGLALIVAMAGGVRAVRRRRRLAQRHRRMAHAARR
jgi:hypothetical protein